MIADNPVFEKLRKAVETVDKHQHRILERWTSSHNNARLEGFNGIFKAAKARARGYRNTATFITIIYRIAAPLGNLFNSI
jgi:transposase